MKILKISILAFVFTVSTVFISCDCLRYVQGIVIDAETQLPIDSVKIGEDNSPDMIVNIDSFVYTDSLGHFEIFSPAPKLFVCPKILLSFEKEGYNKTTKKYRNWNGNVVIILEKQAK